MADCAKRFEALGSGIPVNERADKKNGEASFGGWFEIVCALEAAPFAVETPLIGRGVKSIIGSVRTG